MTNPSVFIGSSSEGIEVARAVEFQLQNDAEITIWNEAYFGLGQSYLETLVNALDRFDFAILILTPDDFTVSREIQSQSPRDNVMFELGLFMGRLGRSRTFAVYDSQSNLKIPSDLAGITHATYKGQRTDNNLVAAVGPACFLIRKAIKDLGLVESKSMQRLNQATDQVQSVSALVERMIYLLTRSRAVELDIIAKQFAPFIPTTQLKQMLKDLQDLQETIEQKSEKDE